MDGDNSNESIPNLYTYNQINTPDAETSANADRRFTDSSNNSYFTDVSLYSKI